MENASKALLIAASVLIVILLIAFGMKIFDSTSGTADSIDGTMQTTEMAMFNNKFLPYIGKNKSKSDVLALLNIIQAHNATNSREITIDASGTINSSEIEYTTISGAINGISNLNISAKFEIIPLDTDSNGYYDEIDIRW